MAWPPLSSPFTEVPPAESEGRPHWGSNSPRHRRHRRRKLSSSISPSSKLLSLLASLASASTANASPTPPSFLCPSLGSGIPDFGLSRRSEPLEKDNVEQPADSTKIRFVPEKFVESPDGVWRRVKSYTLYGVTAPADNCDEGACVPLHTMSSIGLTSKAGNDNRTKSAVEIQLPPGWRTPAPPPNGRTTMILAVSLALSLFIGLLVIMCLLWRKAVLNQRKRTSDVEAKHRRRSRIEDLTPEERRNIEAEKEAKALQKFWARASARWKANALRQRRGKRLFIRSLQSRPQSSSCVEDSRSRLALSTSRSYSRSILNRDQSHEELSQISSQQPPRRPSSPPAYQQRSEIPPIIISSPDQLTSLASGYSTPSHSQRPSQPSPYFSTTNSQPSPDPFPATAHVATDDKALLARLADLASAPEDEETAVDTSLQNISAPAWNVDMELEGIVSIAASTCTDSDSVSHPPLFPPPPSKESLAAAERLDYSFGYGDLEHVEPEQEPSAPPFEEGSMPPLDELLLLPSAPPLNDEEDCHVVEPQAACLPGAPAIEDVYALQENVSGQNHERITLKIDG